MCQKQLLKMQKCENLHTLSLNIQICYFVSVFNRGKQNTPSLKNLKRGYTAQEKVLNISATLFGSGFYWVTHLFELVSDPIAHLWASCEERWGQIRFTIRFTQSCVSIWLTLRLWFTESFTLLSALASFFFFTQRHRAISQHALQSPVIVEPSEFIHFYELSGTDAGWKSTKIKIHFIRIGCNHSKQIKLYRW